MIYTDIIGYIGTAVVVLSFTIADFNKFRIVNIMACGIFIYYGYLSKTTPTIIVNSLIVLVNLYYLIKSKIKTNGIK